MNVKLFREIQNAIRQEPDRFDMSDWVNGHQTDGSGNFCGTAACIAGFACVLEANREKPARSFKDRVLAVIGLATPAFMVQWEVRARELLDIDLPQANRLFYTSNWPEPFRAEYYDGQTKECRAKAASKRIDHFIKTEGRE